MRKVPHKCIYLKLRSAVGDAGWEAYGTGYHATLLEELHHQGQALRVYSLAPLPVCSVCFMFAMEDVTSQLSALASKLPLPRWSLSYLSGTVSQNKLFHLQVAFWSWCLITATEK